METDKDKEGSTSPLGGDPKKEAPVQPEKNIPVKPDKDPDPTQIPEKPDSTRIRPGINEPEKTDPTRIPPQHPEKD